LNTVHSVLCECDDAQFTVDRNETYLFHGRDRRHVMHAACVLRTNARRVSTVMLVWSKIMGDLKKYTMRARQN